MFDPRGSRCTGCPEFFARFDPQVANAELDERPPEVHRPEHPRAKVGWQDARRSSGRFAHACN